MVTNRIDFNSVNCDAGVIAPPDDQCPIFDRSSGGFIKEAITCLQDCLA